MRYNQLVKEIENAPMTWLPALFHHVIKACLKKGVFESKTGMSRYCRKIESGEISSKKIEHDTVNAEIFVR
jgi:hypothetical protein